MYPSLLPRTVRAAKHQGHEASGSGRSAARRRAKILRPMMPSDQARRSPATARHQNRRQTKRRATRRRAEIGRPDETEPRRAPSPTPPQKTPPVSMIVGALIAGPTLASLTGAETGNRAKMPAVVGRRKATSVATDEPHATPPGQKNPPDAMAEAAKTGIRAPSLKRKQPTVAARPPTSSDPPGTPTPAFAEP